MYMISQNKALYTRWLMFQVTINCFLCILNVEKRWIVLMYRCFFLCYLSLSSENLLFPNFKISEKSTVKPADKSSRESKDSSNSTVKTAETLVKGLQIQVEAWTAKKIGLLVVIMISNFTPVFVMFCFFFTFYTFLGPAVSQLNYRGSDLKLLAVKCGQTRKLQPIDELFRVLYHLRCNRH